MTELLTAAQMRAIEMAAIVSGNVTGLELMERAGRGVVDAIFSEWPQLAAGSFRAVVLCGPGGNGGDGFVVARLLKEWGWEVKVFLYGDPERMPPDARANYERWCGMGEIYNAAEIRDHDQLIDLEPDVFVDGLFGIGLSRQIVFSADELRGFFDYSQRWLFDSGAPTVSIDVPSGVCSDSGRSLGAAMTAALTVTFHAAKVGHFLADDDGSRCRKLSVVDIGLPKQHRLNLPERIRSTCQRIFATRSGLS